MTLLFGIDHVVHGGNGDTISCQYVCTNVFATRGQAERYIREQHTRFPWDYRVKPIHWTVREDAKFNYGIYTRPVFFDALPSGDHKNKHFLHVSLDDPTQVAFTASDEHGERDRQTRMNPGRYLAKYYPELGTRQISYMTAWFNTGERPPVELTGKIAFATEPDDIVRAYAQGPHSCMKGSDSVRVYGAGDLAVAYVEDPKNPTRVISRALCWPEKQVFSRIYPSSGNWQADGFSSNQESLDAVQGLKDALKAMGYQDTYMVGHDAMNGARLLKIRTPCQNDWVMPYVDHTNVSDDGDYWVFDRDGDYGADMTDGTMSGEAEDEDDDSTTCDHCDTRVPADDTDHVYTSPSMYRGVTLCEICCGDETFYCEATSQTYYSDDRVEVEHYTKCGSADVHGDWATDNCFESGYSDGWYLNDTLVTTADGTRCSHWELDDDFLYCEFDGEFYTEASWLSELFVKYPLFLTSETLTERQAA